MLNLFFFKQGKNVINDGFGTFFSETSTFMDAYLVLAAEIDKAC